MTFTSKEGEMMMTKKLKKLPDSFDWFTDRNLTSTFTAKYFSWEAAGTQEKFGKT